MFKYTVKRQIKQLPGNVTVFAAVQKDLDRPVEIRVLNHFVRTDSDEYLRFEREFKTIARLDHPNIIKVFDWGIANDKIYYVAEMKQAHALDDLAAQNEANFTVPEILDIGRQIAAALAYLHKNNIVHRDVNFGSINWQKDKKVAYIAHFSLVKNLNLEDLTARGVGHFQQLMMTPEKLLGLPVDVRTDLYLYGAFMYHLATGVDLLAGPKGEGILPVGDDRVFAHEKPRIKRPDLPEEAEAVIMKCLAKEPDKRYQTAAEVQKAFEDVIEDHRVRSKREATARMKAVDDGPALAPAAAAAAPVAAAGAGLPRRASAERPRRGVGASGTRPAASPPSSVATAPASADPSLSEMIKKVDVRVLAAVVGLLALLVVGLLVVLLT